MAPTSPKIIFGTTAIAQWSKETGNEMIEVLQKHNVKDLDTAYLYPNSEETLKEYGVVPNFTIHTKAPGFIPGAHGKQSIIDGMNESLKRLGTSHVETYFLHAPDDSVPIEETLTAITQLHNEGKFTHFGVSNFPAASVQQIHSIQSANKAILPTVYQGNYNAVSRHIETDLFPVLRKLNIAFYAYSPIAGGFLVKDPTSIETGRFNKDAGMVAAMYNKLYNKPSLLAALEEWNEIAKEEGISKAALAYRWVAWHSALKGPSDGVIVGASKAAQLEESLSAIETGPLSEKSAKRIDEVWKKVEAEAPIDNYHSFLKQL